MIYCDCDCEGCGKHHVGNKSVGRGLEANEEFATEELVTKLREHIVRLNKKITYAKQNFMQEHRTQLQNWEEQFNTANELIENIELGDLE